MHIAVSGRAMGFAAGGVREYVRDMTRALLDLGTSHRFSIYYKDSDLLGTYPQAREVYLKAPHKFVWDHWVLPRTLRQDRPDVVWYPHNVSSLGLSIPTVVSVMDLLYFPVPEFKGREYGWADIFYMRLFMPPSLRKAQQIMAISSWTAYDLRRLLGVPQAKIHTIHLAPGADFKPQPLAAVAAVREKYELVQPYFFYAGSLTARKNVRLLIEAFGRIKDRVPHDLVLTGGGNNHSPSIRIDDLIAGYGIERRVRRLGLVSRSELTALYCGATAFVYPSLYEGFGLPSLEAFACGCPVISSNGSALAEVVGDAALAFNPRDVAGLAEHMNAVASNQPLRQVLIEAGSRRVQQFNYERSARKLLQILEEAPKSID